MIIVKQPNNAYGICNYCKSEYELTVKDWKKVKWKYDIPELSTSRAMPFITCKFCHNKVVIKVEEDQCKK